MSQNLYLRLLWELSSRDSSLAAPASYSNFLTTNFGIKTFRIKKIGKVFAVVVVAYCLLCRYRSLQKKASGLGLKWAENRKSSTLPNDMILPLMSRPANV